MERLRAWKQEAMKLFDGLQDLGRALDLPLGVLVTGPLAIEAANRLRAERDAAVVPAGARGDRVRDELLRLADWCDNQGTSPTTAELRAIAGVTA